MWRILRGRTVLSAIYNRTRITRIYRDLHGLFVARVEDNDAATEITAKNNPDKKVCFPMKNLFLFDPVQGRWLGGEPDPWVSPMATQIGLRRSPLSNPS